MSDWKKIKDGNFRLINNMGGGLTKPQDFARIRSFGDKNSAVTHDGLRVERQEYLFVEGYGMVRCLPTTLHFIYEDKSKKIGRWAFMCTCGSLGGIIAYDEIKEFITTESTGYLLACIHGVTNKQNTGIFRHADGSSE